jgi:ATP-dependent Clp protease ATP-binding subunit ClpA
MVEIDLAEYKTLDRLGLLLGTSDADPGRIAEGYDACGGTGTLLLDEIDKAHPRILDILLNLLEPARLTTGRNRVLDFSAWYIVLTSNLGAGRIMTMRRSIYETMRRLVVQDAQSELRPEIFNRITEAVVFNRLNYDTQCRIAEVLVGRELQRQRDQGHAMTLAPGVVDVIIKRGFHERLGARPMRNAAELLIRNALTHDLLHGGMGSGRLRAHADGSSLHLESSAS